MKNKNRPKQPEQKSESPQFPPAQVDQNPTRQPATFSASPGKPSRSGAKGVPIVLALVAGVLLGVLLMTMRGGGDNRKVADELRADVLRTSERRAERMYAEKDANAAGALLDFTDVLDDHLSGGYGNSATLRKKLLVTHARLAGLFRDTGQSEKFQKHLLKALVLAPSAAAGNVTNEKSLFAFLAEQDAAKPAAIPSVLTTGNSIDGGQASAALPPVGVSPVPVVKQPAAKGNVVFVDETARADVEQSDLFEFGEGNFTWVGFYKSIIPPNDHHVLVMAHPENPRFYVDFSENDIRISLGGGNNLVMPFKAEAFDGNWHSIIVKRELGIIHGFFDGTPIGSGKRDKPSGTDNGWTFGHLNQDNHAQTIVGGSIKDFSFWNRALSAQEITEIAKGKKLGGKEQGLVAYWPLDDGDGATFREVVGGRHGTLKGNFIWDRDADRDTKLARQLQERQRPFNDVYAAWHKKLESLRGEPIVTFIELPEYRAFVALGRPALDGLQRKLTENKGLDFLLADAAIEIAGWNREQIPSTDLRERSRIVLDRLRKFPKHQH